LDHCLVPSVVESSIIVTSASGVLADQVAEHTVALLTGLLRSLPVYFKPSRKRNTCAGRRAISWPHDRHRRPGGVGRRVAQVLAPFKTRILATDMYPVDKPPLCRIAVAGRSVGRTLPLGRYFDSERAANGSNSLEIRRPTVGDAEAGGAIDERRPGAVGRGSDLVAALESGHLKRGGLGCRRGRAVAGRPTAGCGTCRT